MVEKEEEEEEKKGWRGCGWHFVRRKCPMEEAAMGYRVLVPVSTAIRVGGPFAKTLGHHRPLFVY
jgi:hypothetical protein